MGLGDLVALIPGAAAVHDVHGSLVAASDDAVELLNHLVAGPNTASPWTRADVDPEVVELAVERGGVRTWVVAQSRLVAWEGQDLVVTSFLDSSERQAWARSMMEEFIGRFRMSWARSGLPVFLIGVDGSDRGQVVATNAAAGELLGRSAEEIEGLALAECFAVPAGTSVALDEHLGSLIDGETSSVSARVSVGDASGDPAAGTALLGLTCTTSPTGRPLFVLGYAIDQGPLRQAEERRRLDAERSELIHRHGSDAVIVISADGTVEWIGPSTEPMLGFVPSEHLGRNVLEVIHRDDHALAAEALASTVTRAGAAAPLRLRAIDVDGAPRWVEVVANNLLDEPSVAGVVLNIRDRSGDRDAEEQTAERERRYRGIVELAFDGIASIDEHMHITYANARLCEILGRRADDVIGAGMLDFVAPDEQLRVTALLSAADAERYDRFPLTLVDANGRRVDTVVSAAPRASDGSAGLVAWVSDVSEAQRARAELQQSEERLNALLGALPDLIFRFDREGTYLDYHSADPDTLALAPEEFLGKRIVDVFPDDVAPGVADLFVDTIHEVLEQRSMREVRYELRLGDEFRQFEARLTPLGTAGVLAVVRDISKLHRSERRRIEQDHELERSRREVEQAEIERELERATRLEAVGHLASMMAHDVNNLLGVINNYAAAIQRRDAEPDDVEDAAAIARAVVGGSELTQRLLNIGKGDASDLGRVSLGALLAELRPSLDRLFDGTTNISFDMVLMDQACIVDASRSRIEQATINLVLNARDAYRDNHRTGKVQVTLESRSDPVAADEVACGWAVLSVSDHAGGVPASIRDRLFEPFVSTKGTEGSGLGLSIVQQVAEQHGGMVKVHTDHSGATAGTSVELWLPCATQADRTAPRTDTGAGAQLTILVVDDEPDMRASLQRLLSNFGCVVIDAADIGAALEVLARTKVDLVISDVRMADGTGPELVRRARSTGHDSRIVLMTGYPGDLPGDSDLADVPVLAKPFAAMDLFAVMSELQL